MLKPYDEAVTNDTRVEQTVGARARHVKQILADKNTNGEKNNLPTTQKGRSNKTQLKQEQIKTPDAAKVSEYKLCCAC